ncbi:MAG: hypothetical protein KAQ67_10735, partial [Gammaproteobacteria bacterium]|nr:hypothetical protein [Gammaproteobacteria bacterium]
MNSHKFLSLKLLIFIPFFLLLTSCAAGDAQFTSENLAGFFYGLWHGVISFISLFIHIFNDNVTVYEINNTGGWYDFGFLFGVTSIWGGGCHFTRKSAADKKRDKEWDEIGEKVEKKVMYKLKDWAADEENT